MKCVKIFNTSYVNRDIVTNYWYKISCGLIFYRVKIENYKSCFHYNYEKNPENRLDFQCFDDVVNEPSLVESSNFQYLN